jgi:hypothetical protein
VLGASSSFKLIYLALYFTVLFKDSFFSSQERNQAFLNRLDKLNEWDVDKQGKFLRVLVDALSTAQDEVFID